MRILLLANTLPPHDLSGVGEQVLQLAAGLRRRGHEVEVLGRGPGAARGPKILFSLTVLPACWRALRRLRPEVVQVHESDGALAALLVRTVGALRTPPPRLVALLQVSYVEEMRAVRPLRSAGRVLGAPGWAERRFLWLKAPLQVVLGCLTAWLADVVLAPSQRTAGEIERDYQVGPVSVVPNVTGGLAVATTTGGDGEELAGGYLLFVGRLRIRKGVEVLLEALTRLAAEEPAARLLVAGDGEHRRALERRTAALGLQGRVEFLGRCDAARVRRLLAGARALVVPSIYEGMPLVVLEAMEAGRAVVASAVSGIPEVVEDGVTGWLVPAEDVDALYAALAECWRRPELAARRGAQGAQRVAERYRPEQAAARWEERVCGRARVESP